MENQKKRPQFETAAGPAGATDLIEGRNAVLEALRAGRTIDKLYLAAGSTDRALDRIAAMAKQAGAVVVTADRRKLNAMSATGAHQGVIAAVAAHTYCTLQTLLDTAKQKSEAPLLVLCDELADPPNLGAIIRTAECAGAHGVVITKRRSVGLTAVVDKAAAGALEYLPVARVTNLTQAIEFLKQQGVWVYGAAMGGQTAIYDADFAGPTAIVIGSEGFGMGRLVESQCDVLVRIPMLGRITSLNASAAAAVLLYEAVRQRT